jgi:hypothetical protein
MVLPNSGFTLSLCKHHVTRAYDYHPLISNICQFDMNLQQSCIREYAHQMGIFEFIRRNNKGDNPICVITTYLGNPSIPHTTAASLLSHWSSQIVPHLPSWYISTRP